MALLRKEGEKMISTRAKKVTWRKWEAPPERIRKRLPKRYFLLEGSKKFPYREWKGPLKGCINCNALKVAIPRAILSGHPTAYWKARRLFERYCRKRRGKK